MEDENRVLRSNLLALKRLLLERQAEVGVQQGEEREEDDISEGGVVGTAAGTTATEPMRQRPRVAQSHNSSSECAQLRTALERAFRECQATAAECDAWRARCAEQARVAAQREEELSALHGVVDASEIKQRAAARELKKARDLERRLHSQFVLFFPPFSPALCEQPLKYDVAPHISPKIPDWRTPGVHCGGRGSLQRRTRR